MINDSVPIPTTRFGGFMLRTRVLVSLAAGLALAGCARDTAPTEFDSPLFAKAASASATAAAMQAPLDGAHAALAHQSGTLRVAMAKYITNSGSGEVGAQILQKDVGN